MDFEYIYPVLILFGSFAVMLAIGVPITFAIGLSSLLSIITALPPDAAISVISQKMTVGLDGFTLLAIPFFVLAGNIMNTGGIARRLVNLAQALVGRLPGSLAHCNILANTLFGAISGSAVASAAAVGGIMSPLQEKEGYDPAFSAAVNIASAPIGLMIPPSNVLIVYSLASGEAASIVDRIRGFFEPSSILVSTLVLTLRPTGLLPLVTDSLPMRLLPTEIMAGSPIRSRDISLGDDPGINGQLWDVNRIDVTAQQGTWERWTVRADEPQAFHIEGVMFQIRNVNGAMPFPEDRGWKDTVWVDGQVELLVYFGQPSWAHFPFYFNSQTLEMADRGSIGQLLVNPVP
ncbi:TRAP transporter large permease subunit [Escherichia coli]|uniref:TRAP transporter large permease subunit n=1 Tax=Escherichia coli TaxID=562 RepID=UPI003EDEFE4D